MNLNCAGMSSPWILTSGKPLPNSGNSVAIAQVSRIVGDAKRIK